MKFTLRIYTSISRTCYREIKKNKAPGVDKIPSELIQAGGGKLYEEIHRLIIFIWNKEGIPLGWK